MKKAIKIVASIVTMLFIMTVGVHAATKLTATTIANHFNAKVGNAYTVNSCLKFIADSFAELGATRSSACCAYKYGSQHIQSTDINSIPVEADMTFTGNAPAIGSGAFNKITATA